MIEIVKSGKYVNGHSICERCGCEFKYTKEDVQRGEHVRTTSKTKVTREKSEEVRLHQNLKPWESK